MLVSLFFFFFQAEDGIRDKLVTGVQTCALPISRRCQLDTALAVRPGERADADDDQHRDDHADDPAPHRPELGPLGPEQLGEAVTSGAQLRPVRGQHGHGVASARNSTASLVSSMYASSKDARWDDSSANGTEFS